MCQWARVSAATHRGAQRATSATRHFCVRARSRPTRPSQRRRRRRTRGGSLAACSALARSAQSAPDWRYACSAHLCRAPQAQYLVQTPSRSLKTLSLFFLLTALVCQCGQGPRRSSVKSQVAKMFRVTLFPECTSFRNRRSAKFFIRHPAHGNVRIQNGNVAVTPSTPPSIAAVFFTGATLNYRQY